MYIPTRSIVVEITKPVTKESLVADITAAVRELAAELDEHATGRGITVCLENPIDLRYDVMLDGMYVSTVGSGQGYPVNSVHLGHGVDSFESFVIPPGGVLGME